MNKKVGKDWVQHFLRLETGAQLAVTTYPAVTARPTNLMAPCLLSAQRQRGHIETCSGSSASPRSNDHHRERQSQPHRGPEPLTTR